MPIVTGIRDNRGVMEIDVDGSTALRVRRQHFALCPLRERDEIDVEDYVNRVAAVQFPDAYEAALTSLDRAERTAREIASSLRRRGYVPPAVDAVIARLTENGLVDDARYAERLAETQSKKPVGLYAFRRKLRAKGISEEDAAEALSAFDESQQRDACLAAARKLARKYAELPPREARARLSQALARRGFAWDVVSQALDGLIDDEDGV